MSFEDFDYSKLLLSLADQIVKLDEQIVVQTTERDQLAGSNYITIVQDKIDSLTRSIDDMNLAKIKSQEVIDEVNTMLSLSVENKALLYYFWTVVQSTKNDFMMRMPFNYTAALGDPNISELLSDEVTSSEIKTKIAKVVYNAYEINVRHIRQLIQQASL